MTERMMSNDANGDGKLTPEEVPDQFRGMLRNADENDDGSIDAKELASATRRMGERFGRGGAGRPERSGRGGDDEEDGERPSRRQRPEAEE
jgi:hypothetical protein